MGHVRRGTFSRLRNRRATWGGAHMRHRKLVVLALIAAALTLLIAQGGAAAHKQSSHATKQHVRKDSDPENEGRKLKHIFVIMLENHSQSSVIGDSNPPFITHLSHSNAMPANYSGVIHPSLPTYLPAT